MTSDVFPFQSSQELRRKIQSHIASPASPLPPAPQTALFRLLTEALRGGSAPFGTRAGSRLDPGPRPPSLVSQAQIPHPGRGASPRPSLSTHSRLGPACSLPSQALLTRLPLPDPEATAQVPPPPFAALYCKSGFLHNSDGGGGVEEDGGEWRPSPSRDRQRRPLDPWIRKRGNPALSSQASGLCLGWGPHGSIICPGPHPPNGTPIPTPSRDAAVSAGRG